MAWCGVVEPRTLRECRIALGQSQAAFAAMLGVSLESYRTWDAGRRATPPKILARARALATHRDDHENTIPVPPKAFSNRHYLGPWYAHCSRCVRCCRALLDAMHEGGRCGGEVPRERVVGAATETAAARHGRGGASVQRQGRRGMPAPTAARMRRTRIARWLPPSTPASVPTVWRAVRALGLTVKKNGRPSEHALTSRPRGSRGTRRRRPGMSPTSCVRNRHHHQSAGGTAGHRVARASSA